MILGIDFDNTLACYDGLFHAEAVRRGMLPATVPTHKQGVRDALRAQGRDADFTLLQGHIYGPGLANAPVYTGAKECICGLLKRGVDVHIISHKTPFPYLGPQYDLHEAARNWLDKNGFFAPDMLPRERVYLERSLDKKLARIAQCGCTHFVDDLPEFLGHPHFPAGVERLLFAPEGTDVTTFPTFSTWQAIAEWLATHR